MGAGDVRLAIGATLLAVLVLFVAFASTAATVGVDQATDGRRHVLTCVSIGSIAVTTTSSPPYTNATKWTPVRGSQRAEPCPTEQPFDNAFEFQT